MYRRPKFLEVLLDIRREMAHEADYDTDLFAEMVRSGHPTPEGKAHSLAYDDVKPARRRARSNPKKEE